MITLKALRLAAIVMSHGAPRCSVSLLPNGGNVLVATCWATKRVGDNSCITVQLTEHIAPTVASVSAYLGY